MPRMNKDEMVGNTPHVSSRLIGNNGVRIVQADGTVIMRHFKTDVVTFKPNGDIILNTSGNKTFTTKKRLNEWQDVVHVWKQNHVWYVASNSDPVLGDIYKYKDGIVIHPDGTIE